MNIPTKPLVRWWWFADDIQKRDIVKQLDWVKAHHFGGVEIAWVYPLYRYNSIYTKHHGKTFPSDVYSAKWLSEDWSKLVTFAKEYSDSIGLRCDFTLGSAWPSAAPEVEGNLSTQIYGDSNFRQAVTFAWNYPDSLFVINHLDSHAFSNFSKPISRALSSAMKGKEFSLFSDSWEIKLNDEHKLWTQGFEMSFQEKFGYDIIPFMEEGIDKFPEVRYDYMKHINEYILNGFYRPFSQLAKEKGAVSRVQCLASPTDLMSAYAIMDIPESEALLNNPSFSRIVSSTASLASQPLVSCETFTCMYGFPGTYMREEQVADLKMLVDALFANGVNMFVYHGMPYHSIDNDTNDFFATTYFGPKGALENEVKELNEYVSRVSYYMRKGRTYSDVAVYIPYEDALMKGAYPIEKQRAWVWGEYEMRYLEFPDELLGYHPLWINKEFIEKAVFENGSMNVGDASFSSLFIDVNFIDYDALKSIHSLAKKGLAVCLKRIPKEAGKQKHEDFEELIKELSTLNNVESQFQKVINKRPLIKAEEMPTYWARIDENQTTYLFIAQDKSKDLKYPLYSGQSYDPTQDTLAFELTVSDKSIPMNLIIPPYQSTLFKIDALGNVEEIDIQYVPKTPTIRPLERQRGSF